MPMKNDENSNSIKTVAAAVVEMNKNDSISPSLTPNATTAAMFEFDDSDDASLIYKSGPSRSLKCCTRFIFYLVFILTLLGLSLSIGFVILKSSANKSAAPASSLFAGGNKSTVDKKIGAGGLCPTGWHHNHSNYSCWNRFVGHRHRRTWSEAQHRCASFNATLISFHDLNKVRYFIDYFMKQNQSDSIWIGSTESVWIKFRLLGGSAANYWSKAKSTKTKPFISDKLADCTYKIMPTYRRQDCQKKRDFICEMHS